MFYSISLFMYSVHLQLYIYFILFIYHQAKIRLISIYKSIYSPLLYTNLFLITIKLTQSL